jgi:hypothetical protein
MLLIVEHRAGSLESGKNDSVPNFYVNAPSHKVAYAPLKPSLPKRSVFFLVGSYRMFVSQFGDG